MLPRLLPIAGNAGATMVCSSAERNIASMMPATMERMAAMIERRRGRNSCTATPSRPRKRQLVAGDVRGDAVSFVGGDFACHFPVNSNSRAARPRLA